MFTMPRALPTQITSPIVAVLIRLGVTANMLTVAQLVGGIIAAYVIAQGELVWGGVVVVGAATLDAFDGTLARTTGSATSFGGVFDSTIDRLFEGAVYAGVLYYYVDQGAKTESLLVLVATVGSLCVSYVRARAEVEGVSMYEGFFTRVVRILLLTAGLVLSGLTLDALMVVLWVLAVMTLVTTFHRLYIAHRELSKRQTDGAP